MRWAATGPRWWRDLFAGRFARVGTRLTVAFLAISLLIPLVGLVSIRQQQALSLRAAQIEAQHVAETVAHAVAQRGDDGTPQLYQQPAELQRYVSDIQRDLNRDIKIVGLDRRILADALPRNQGRLFTEDPAGEVGATMRDGRPRTFAEHSVDFPQGIELVAVAMRSTRNTIVGAVVLEYTPLYQELLAAGAHTRRVIVATSLGGMLAALALGFFLARGLVRDLRRLTWAADLLAIGHADARAQVGAHGELGELAAAFNGMADRIAEQKAALTELAVTDPLTDLRNRRSFQTILDDETERARRFGTPLALLMLDLDHFKSVNDRYGHLAGDAVLRAVAAILERELRTVDVAARLGGEEFGVLLPGSDQQAAEVTAERLRVAIAQSPIVHLDATMTITTSIGVASYPEHAQTSDDLLQRAEDALYSAKRTGRDRVSGPPRQHPPERTPTTTT